MLLFHSQKLKFLFCQQVFSIDRKLNLEAVIWKQFLLKINFFFFFFNYSTYAKGFPHLKIVYAQIFL